MFVVCIGFIFLYYYNMYPLIISKVLQKCKDNIYSNKQKCYLCTKYEIYIIIIFNTLAKQTHYNHIFKPLHNTLSNYNNINLGIQQNYLFFNKAINSSFFMPNPHRCKINPPNVLVTNGFYLIPNCLLIKYIIAIFLIHPHQEGLCVVFPAFLH